MTDSGRRSGFIAGFTMCTMAATPSQTRSVTSAAGSTALNGLLQDLQKAVALVNHDRSNSAMFTKANIRIYPEKRVIGCPVKRRETSALSGRSTLLLKAFAESSIVVSTDFHSEEVL
jgi:hypothetical protein